MLTVCSVVLLDFGGYLQSGTALPRAKKENPCAVTLAFLSSCCYLGGDFEDGVWWHPIVLLGVWGCLEDSEEEPARWTHL